MKRRDEKGRKGIWRMGDRKLPNTISWTWLGEGRERKGINVLESEARAEKKGRICRGDDIDQGPEKKHKNIDSTKKRQVAKGKKCSQN